MTALLHAKWTRSTHPTKCCNNCSSAPTKSQDYCYFCLLFPKTSRLTVLMFVFIVHLVTTFIAHFKTLSIVYMLLSAFCMYIGILQAFTILFHYHYTYEFVKLLSPLYTDSEGTSSKSCFDIYFR